jgi:2-iminobutanoate/2-iminopropanoate deaminase
MLERIKLNGEVGSYSDAVITDGRVAFVSGHGPLTDGEIVRGTLEEETNRTLSNLVATIEAIGGRKDTIVKCNCYLSDMSQYGAFDAAYRAFFGPSVPARTTVGVVLYDGMKVEIEALVALDG